MEKPLFTVLALVQDTGTCINFKPPIKVQLRCNTCGYDKIYIPMVLGQRFHCPACKKCVDNEITSVLPFVMERVKTEGTTDVEVQGVH